MPLPDHYDPAFINTDANLDAIVSRAGAHGFRATLACNGPLALVHRVRPSPGLACWIAPCW